MGINSEYYKEKNKKRLTKLKEIEKALPPYVVSYLDDKELSSQINTVIAYAYDMQTFLKFLTERNTLLKNTAIKDISIDFLEILLLKILMNIRDILDLMIRQMGAKANIRIRIKE